ncbi:hypothetical protein BH18CHL2_BH18CHL2_04850 [soil metagenome]
MRLVHGAFRQTRTLVPYALVAVMVVVGSAGALGYALADLRDLHEAKTEAPPPGAASIAAARALPELSRAGRLAYWRPDGSTSGADLVVSNVDGTLRRPVARAESIRRVSLTRWTPDGGAVAYVENGVNIQVVRLDGTTERIALSADTRSAGYRIVDQRWSHDGKRIAVSALRADLRSDVFTGALGADELVSSTSLGDVFAGEWLDGERLLVHTGGGIVGILRPGPADQIRPLTGLSGTSPILADDGRIHFLSGSISATPRDLTLPFLTASGATVWSIDANGNGLRRETQTQADDVRLDARFAPGRYLAHRGSSQVQVVLGESISIPSIDAGPVERAIVAPDGRSAIGFTSSRIVRFELRGAASSTLGAPAVMLDAGSGGDVWHPRVLSLDAAPAPPAGGGPAARYAFTLGGHLWSMAEDGAVTFLRPRTAQVGRRQLPPPAWSATGERVLTLELAGAGLPGITALTPIAVSVARDGQATRFEDSRAATATPSWAPDGSAFAVVVDRRGVDGTSAQAELEVRFLGVDGRAARPPIAGRDAVWTAAGVVVLTESAIDIVDAGGRRAIATRERILSDPRGEFPSEPASVTVSALGAARDATYVSLRVAVTPRTGASRFAIPLIRARDGAVVTFLPGATTQDPSWAPAGALFGYTSSSSQQQTAEVRDVPRDRVIASQSGRFAGWSPDASWYYVARPEGLFAFPVAGGEGIRVSALGVPVSTTAR